MSDLLYHTGALGDFIAAIPAIHYYRNRNADCRLTLLCKPAIGRFAQDIGLADDWQDIDNPKYLPLFYEAFSGEAEKILSDFTTAILFTGADSPIIKNIAQSSITRLFHQPPFPSTQQPVIDYHLSLFGDPETIAPSEKIPAIVPSAEANAASEKILSPDNPRPVAIHPGSGSEKKNWPFDNYLSVANHLRSKKIPVLWIKGPAEDSLGFPPEDLSAANLPLSVLAALLAKCRAFVGNDSGVTHLAAAVGCKTVAIFGPSDPVVWGPRGKNVTLIYKKTPCIPGHGPSKNISTRDNSCLSAISTEDVLGLFTTECFY